MVRKMAKEYLLLQMGKSMKVSGSKTSNMVKGSLHIRMGRVRNKYGNMVNDYSDD